MIWASERCVLVLCCFLFLVRGTTTGETEMAAAASSSSSSSAVTGSADVKAGGSGGCPHRRGAAAGGSGGCGPHGALWAAAAGGAVVTLAAVAGWMWFRHHKRRCGAGGRGGCCAAKGKCEDKPAAGTVVSPGRELAALPLSAELTAESIKRGLPQHLFPLHKLQPSKCPDRPLVVLVSCGSFSPVTYLHLRIFEMARDALQVSPADGKAACEVIGGYLSPVHDAYGKKSLIPAHHRVAICQRAVSDSAWLSVSQWETEQNEWIRTAPVLDLYHDWLNACASKVLYGGRPIRLLMLCGADLLQTFLTPDLWSQEHMHRILSNGLAVLTRQGTDLTELLKLPLFAPYVQNIHVVPVTIENTISSTAVRDAIHKGQSLKYLMPDAAARYVYEHKLYHPQQPQPPVAAGAAASGSAAGTTGASAGAAAAAGAGTGATTTAAVDVQRHVLLGGHELPPCTCCGCRC